MLLIKSLAALALLSISGAVPVPMPVADDASNTYSYDVVNVDGSNAQATSSVSYGDDSNVSSTIGVAEPTSTGTVTTTSAQVNVVTGTSVVQEPTTTYTVEYTSTTTTTIKGHKKTVWITKTAGQDDPTSAAPQSSQPSTTEATLQNDADTTLQHTVIDGTTYLVSAYVSTIKAPTTITYGSTYTSAIASTGVSTISASTVAVQTSSSAAQSSSTATPAAETSSAAPSSSSTAEASSTTQAPQSSSATSTSSSSTITQAPSPSSSSASVSETAFATVTSDGVCEVYYEDVYDEGSTYYVSGSDASSATTTITSTILSTVTLS